jgi:hypothetical protein
MKELENSPVVPVGTIMVAASTTYESIPEWAKGPVTIEWLVYAPSIIRNSILTVTPFT